MSGWSLDNPVFTTYVFYAGVLALKMLLMAPLTGYFRMTKKVFANPEDAKKFGAKEVKTNDPDVERVRRAHQNDLENIPLFWLVGLLFVLTNPPDFLAKMAFRVYTISRIQHSILYLRGNTYRGLAYLVGVVVNLLMIGNIIYSFW